MANEVAAAGGIGRRIQADVALAVAEPSHRYVLRLEFVIAKDPLDGQTGWIGVFTGQRAKSQKGRLQETRRCGTEISSDEAPDEDLDCVIFI